MRRFADRFVALDAFPKYHRDVRSQTWLGGAISLLAIFLVFLLAISELQAYVTVQREERMEVDAVRGAKMRINFDIRFPAIPCSLISIDVQDLTQLPHEDVLHDVFKKRLSPDGRPLGVVRKEDLGGTVTQLHELEDEEQKGREIAEGRGDRTAAEAKALGHECGPCYGAGAEGQCCSTCDEVRELYRKAGWQFDPSGVEQCKREGFVEDLSKAGKEGCNVYGHVTVPRVGGNLHFAPALDFAAASPATPRSQREQQILEAFNASHIIKQLSFGPYVRGRAAPLDGVVTSVWKEEDREKAKAGHPSAGHVSAVFQYYAKVVPSEYISLGGKRVSTFQFSASKHVKKLHPGTQRGVPGLFIFYDLSPIAVAIEETKPTFGTFLVNLAAVAGGIFAVARVADAWMHNLLAKKLKLDRP